MLALFGLTLLAAVAQPVALEPRDVIGSWHAQRELTMLELHPDFTYDRYFADVIEQGRWALRHHNTLELVYIHDGKPRTSDTYRILTFGKNIMKMHRTTGETDVWLKTSHSAHFPRFPH